MRSIRIPLQKISIIVLLSVTFTYSAHVCPSAYAANTPPKIDKVLRVSPVIVHLNLTPAKTTTYDLTVENLLDIPLPLKALYSDFNTSTEDGGYILTDKNTNSLLSWVSLDHTEWILAPNAKQTITLTINTPQKISLGGYYGLVFFQPLLPQRTSETLVSARVGVLLLGDIGGGTEKGTPGEIATFTLPFLSQKNTLPLLLRVKNTSLNFFTAKPILKIRPLLGEERLQFLEEKTIFPSKIRRWEENVTLDHIGYGMYQITMQVSTGKGNFITETRTVLIFPWIPVGVTLLCLLLITWALKNKLKLKRALIALISPDEQN